MPHPNRPTPHHRQNGGFTLIELLIAITIIAILAGLLLTGVQSARSAVRKAEVAQEIRNLETALTQFHAEFGMYPPSQITLYSTNDSTTGWASPGAVRSRAIIQKLWPDFDFTLPRLLPGGTNSIRLNGAECLVFFLGGIRDASDNLIGFSKNPRNPFDTTGSNRIGPFHEFVYTRLKDFKDSSGANGSNGMWEYYDSFPDQENPIWYMSAYDGRGYRATSPDPGELAPGMLDCYRQGFSFSYDGTNLALASGGVSLPQAWGMKSYQLVSPGPDKVYGLGGYYADGMKQPTKPSWIGTGDWGSAWNQFQQGRKFRNVGGIEGGDEDNVTSISSNMR